MSDPILVQIEYREREFAFEIHHRELLFGHAGPGQYYWMDGRQLRRGQGGPNFQPCVDVWWHGAEQAGEADEVDKEVHLVLAECYPLVNTSRAMQDIFVDAHLHRAADREYLPEEGEGIRRIRSDRTYLLPEEECERLRSVAHSRDLDLIRNELEDLFLGQLPPPEEMPAYQEAARAWIGNGISALRTEGREGLQRYTRTVDEWIRRLRRRGDLDRVRRFVNMFSYECKAAFYRCYCSAWVGILQWLAARRGPNEIGERFMQLWHNQNYAPDEAGISRDVFCGNILALHPLSTVVLTSPEHLTGVGRWVGHPNYDDLIASGRVAECDEYWDLVATILIAAHEYDRSRSRWEAQRTQAVLTNSETTSQQSRDDAVASVRLLFEDFAAAHRRVCPNCAGALAYVRHEAADGEQASVEAIFRCQVCDRETTIEVSREDLGG